MDREEEFIESQIRRKKDEKEKMMIEQNIVNYIARGKEGIKQKRGVLQIYGSLLF
jgi:hypothetical protein